MYILYCIFYLHSLTASYRIIRKSGTSWHVITDITNIFKLILFRCSRHVICAFNGVETYTSREVLYTILSNILYILYGNYCEVSIVVENKENSH